MGDTEAPNGKGRSPAQLVLKKAGCQEELTSPYPYPQQQLYVASAVGVTQLSLHRPCQAYGAAWLRLLPRQDPYCAWDGQPVPLQHPLKSAVP